MALLLLALAGCAAPQTGPVTMLAVGDSILAWHRLTGGDIPRVAATASGQGSENRSVPGAGFLQSIPGQYREGPWDWVIVNGGANDLARTCGCAACDDTLGALIAPDTSDGAMVRFATDVAARGHRVALLGYYGTSVAGGPFAACAPALTDLSRRLALLAARDARIIFVDAKDVIDPADLSLYDPDLAHPSRTGAALIGDLIARRMAQAATE